jgi:hypothetical protein
MNPTVHNLLRLGTIPLLAAGLLALGVRGQGPAANCDPAAEYTTEIVPLVKRYCLECHSTKVKKGHIDLERFVMIGQVRKDVKPWQQVIEQLEADEMPPRGKPQPTEAERRRLIAWIGGFLEAEAKARTGDPGRVPLRRLSNFEYDCTIRDLTGVDLQPTREFPPDGAGGEGFTNAAEALSDITPALLSRYLAAAKDVADHAVLLPDGFRFSPTKTRRDWTDEATARLRRFYADHTSGEGQLSVTPYLAATIRHRDALLTGQRTIAQVAAQDRLNAKYLGILWSALVAKTPSNPLDLVRKRWQSASERDLPSVVKLVGEWQTKLWRINKIGSYIRAEGPGYAVNLSRQHPVDPPDAPAGLGREEFLQGCAAFRAVFPRFLCFPPVVPTDEVVCLKMFHREDEPLERLFLDADAKGRLDRLWAEHRFISRQPVMENNYLPQFIGFVTQDQPKAMVAHFEGQRAAFKQRAGDFLKDEAGAIAVQLDRLLDFATRAYRRPLSADETAELRKLYDTIRKKGTDHAEAFRGVFARILVAPAFLFRVEQAPPGLTPRPVSDWEVATRLSYFLWSSAPDDELRRLAAAGTLHEAAVLEAQTRRLIADGRLRALAIEFGTQWIHVRGVDQLKEKNEKLFPTFDAALRGDIYEEAILFFQDLFQQDRPISRILDADYTYLNERLARHYGIPGVTGPQWRRVDGVEKYGRGGILALASVHARQSGASRTSPVLRGNWVVETLLGEKLPRPPANVPVLPDVAADKLTTRQMVQQHAQVASCAVCHVRIDPFGFAFEKYDPIGRLREKEAGGLPIDARAKLRDGTEFEGIDGLRGYLLTRKRDVIVRLFCRRLLGYALGRATTLSDTALIEEMTSALQQDEGRVSAAVLAIERSPQFRMIRGGDDNSE